MVKSLVQGHAEPLTRQGWCATFSSFHLPAPTPHRPSGAAAPQRFPPPRVAGRGSRVAGRGRSATRKQSHLHLFSPRAPKSTKGAESPCRPPRPRGPGQLGSGAPHKPTHPQPRARAPPDGLGPSPQSPPAAPGAATWGAGRPARPPGGPAGPARAARGAPGARRPSPFVLGATGQRRRDPPDSRRRGRKCHVIGILAPFE